jgi:IclR family pca regulon transcriptional regulator
VLLAHLAPRELDDYLARVRLHPYTEHTLTTPSRVRGALQAVHETGYAFASQQMEPRLCTIAVPVRDSAGHYVAGINVILQGRLLSAQDMSDQFFRPLHDAALELGSLLLP